MAIDGVTTCLWFDGGAKQAAEFYVATFPGATLGNVSYYPDGEQVLMAEFELFGQPFMALNGGPQYQHSPAASWQVFCDSQEEVDRLWDALTSEGGEEGMCGWCVDRFGVSWQVIPRALIELMGSTEPEVAQRAMAAMLTMHRIDIAGLR